MDFIFYLSYRVETIFNTVIYMSIVGSVLGIFVSIINKLFRNKISPKFRMFFWIITIFMFIVPISFKSVISIYNYLPFNPQNINNNNVARETWIAREYSKSFDNSDEYSSQSLQIKDDQSNNVFAILPALWVIILFSLLFMHLLFYMYYIIKLKNSTKASDNIFDKCTQDMGVKHSILIIQNTIKTAAIIGIWERYVLINKRILELTDNNKEYVFLHELNHIKRKDNVSNIILMIVQCIHFFNPFVYYLFKEIRNDIEEANDEQILSRYGENDRKDYSKLLVKLAQNDDNVQPIQLIGISETKKRIVHRIKTIQRIEYFKKNYKSISVLSSIIIVFLLLVLCARNNEYMSINDLKQLTQKAYNIDNVLIEMRYKEDTFDDEKVTYIYRKDSKEVVKSTDEVQWTDKSTNKSYNVHIDEKTMQVVNYERKVPTLNDEYFNLWSSSLNNGYIYKFCGIEKVNSIDSYKCVMYKKNEYYNIWISVDDGLITKIERSFDTDNKTIHTETNYYYTFDEVLESDIEEANEDLYVGYNIENL